MNQISIWEKESFFGPADVIIAGSGLTGLWAAYYLKKSHPSLSVTIVERGIIPAGASTRNAGFACFGSITELIADAQKMGEDKMLELVEMRYKGLRRIRHLFHDRDTGYEGLGGYELIAGWERPGDGLADSPEPRSGTHGPDMNEFRSHMDWLNRKLKKIIKKQKVFRLQDDKIAEFGFAGVRHLVETRAEGQLHSGKLCLALLRQVQSMGVLVLNNIEIKSFEKVTSRVLLQTSASTGQGEPALTLSAGQLLICTNAFARQLLPELDLEPARGQVLVTSPIEKLPFKGSFHYDEGFYYFRNLRDRVLLGGARNKDFSSEATTEQVITDTIQDELEIFLRETILPGRTYNIDYRWSGIMGMGSEKLPIMKEVSSGVFCAVRMSGMGVALAPVIGEKVARLMMGQQDM
jgi:glycine/D-amino acid oxidase-like deaminating enzyme